MPEIKIATLEELGKFATGVQTELEALKGSVINIPSLDQRLAALERSIGGLTTLVKNPNNWREGDSKEGKAYRLGKFIEAMYQASIHGSQKALEYLQSSGARPNVAVGKEADWKVGEWNFRGEGPDVYKASALGTVLRGDTTTGSYLIPEEFTSEVLRIAADVSAMMGLVRSIPMTVRKINFPKAGTEVSFSWPTNEATAKTEKNPTFSEVELEAKTAAGWITITEEMNEDSLVPLGEYFRDLFGEAWGTEFDKQCLAANADPFTGVLYESGTNALVMDAGKVGFSDMDADDLLNLISELTTKNKRRGARFILHPTITDQVRKLKDANGNYIWQQPNQGSPGAIWGYPYTESDAMPDIGDSAVSTPFIAFGNPRYIFHGNRLGMEFKVFSETLRAVDYDQIFFRCRLRQGFEVALAAGFGILKTPAA
jgi:HK97 family phage major capsid protein